MLSESWWSLVAVFAMYLWLMSELTLIAKEVPDVDSAKNTL